MLKIRQEQMDVLAQLPAQEFLRQTLAQAQSFFPEECLALGLQGVEELLKVGITKAAQYEIVGRGDVREFVFLFLVFGGDFEKQAWAMTILNDPLCSGASKVMALHQAAAAQGPRQDARAFSLLK